MPFFPGIRDDEKVVLFLRRHWSVLVRHLLLFVLLAVLPFGIRWLLVSFAQEELLSEGSLAATLIDALMYLYWLFVAMFAYSSWIDYHLDYWVVTNRRIVSVEQKGLFSRTVAQVYLERIQDSTAQMRGPLQTLLHFGDAFIQSAGEEARFVFAEVPNPNGVVATVMRLHRELEPARPAAPSQSSGV